MTQAQNLADLSQLYSSGIAASFRNRLINGDFRVAYRAGAGNSGALGNVAYICDRWYLYATGAQCNWSSGNGGPYSPNALNVTSTAGNTGLTVGQRIEATNIADLAGQQVTISGWLLQQKGGTPNLQLSYANAGNNFTNRTTIANITLPTLAPGVWKFFVVNVTLPTGVRNGLQMDFQWGALATSGDWIYMSDIQLEAGVNPAPAFERRPFQLEMYLCQRYFQQINGNLVSGYNSNSAGCYFDITLYPPMRAAGAANMAVAPSYSNASGLNANGVTGTFVRMQFLIVATGYGYAYGFQLNLDAEL